MGHYIVDAPYFLLLAIFKRIIYGAYYIGISTSVYICMF
jgi:hypothetical protein